MYDKQGTVVDQREMLKVKVKSLAEEARIIRREEVKTHGVLREWLHGHRIHVVRREARRTHLAYGFIRGRTLAQIEAKAHRPLSEEDKEDVRRMCKKYGPTGYNGPADL